MPKIKRKLTISTKPNTYRDKDKYALVDVVVSTGAPVYHSEYDENGNIIEYYRSLEISEKAIRLERFMQGAPVLDNHGDNDSVARTLGSVHRVWVENGKLLATLKISKITKEDREIVEKIKLGIITSVSVGAEIHQQRNVTGKTDKITHIMATDWEPYEVSLVAVPADKDSIIRSGKLMKNKKKLKISKEALSQLSTLVAADLRKKVTYEDDEEEKEEEERMPKDVKKALEEAEEEDGDESEEKEEEERMPEDEEKPSEEEEKEKEEQVMEDFDSEEVAAAIVDEIVEEIPEAVSSETEEIIEDKVEEAIEEVADGEMTEDMEALAKKIKKRLKRKLYSKIKRPTIMKRKSKISHDSSYEMENRKTIQEQASNALANKLTRGLLQRNYKKEGKVLDQGDFEDLRFSRIADRFLHAYGHGDKALRMSPGQKYDFLLGNRYERRAAGPIAVSSDFSDLLTNTMTKAVLASYEQKRGEQTFDPFVTRVTVDNFKQQDRVALGEHGDLKEVSPGAEAETFAMSDSKESYSIKSYSRIFQLTRQGFIDDDTGQLETVLTSGAAAADLESDLVYNQFTTAQVGGSIWYSNSRGNGIGGTNYALDDPSFDGIKAIYVGFARQTGLDVDTPLNLTFKYLLVPAALHFAANQTKQIQYPSNIAEPNPYATMYEIIQEPRLDGHTNGAVTYYGIAGEAKSFRTFIELGTLTNKPIMKYEEKFASDVLCWKLTHDVGVKMLDYRLGYRVQGS